MNYFDSPHRSIWDVIGERRMEAQRLAELNKPKGDLSPEYVILENAWTWPPAIQVCEPLPFSSLLNANADFEQSSLLVDAWGKRRNLLRIPQTDEQLPEVRAQPRAMQLLKCMLAQWQNFASDVDWSKTHIVLFAPSGLSSEQWLESVLKELPFTCVPKGKVRSTTQPFADWLDETLKNSVGAEHILCLSVDSWATDLAIKGLGPGQVAGESITALKLRRVSQSSSEEMTENTRLLSGLRRVHEPRSQQSRTATEEIDQLVQSLCAQAGMAQEKILRVITDGQHSNNRLTQLHQYINKSLTQCDLQDQTIAVSLLSGQTGETSTQITGIALAFLATPIESGTATLILNRESETVTQGWLVLR